MSRRCAAHALQEWRVISGNFKNGLAIQTDHTGNSVKVYRLKMWKGSELKHDYGLWHGLDHQHMRRDGHFPEQTEREG